MKFIFVLYSVLELSRNNIINVSAFFIYSIALKQSGYNILFTWYIHFGIRFHDNLSLITTVIGYQLFYWRLAVDDYSTYECYCFKLSLLQCYLLSLASTRPAIDGLVSCLFVKSVILFTYATVYLLIGVGKNWHIYNFKLIFPPQ